MVYNSKYRYFARNSFKNIRGSYFWRQRHQSTFDDAKTTYKRGWIPPPRTHDFVTKRGYTIKFTQRGVGDPKKKRKMDNSHYGSSYSYSNGKKYRKMSN